LMGYRGVEKYFYGPNLHEYLREIRSQAFAPYDAFSVGETPGLGMQMCRLVTGEEREELDMVFSFDHLETPGHTRFDDYRYDLNFYKEYQTDWALHYGNNCRMSLFYNNHDNPRMLSKVNPEPMYRQALAKLLAVMQFTLPGTPFVYQGDEMGLENYDFKGMSDINDVESRNLYEELVNVKNLSPEEAFKVILAGTRDHARVLLPWNDNAPFKQTPDEEVVKFYREFLAFRKTAEEIIYGEFRVLRDTTDVFTYERNLDGVSLVVDCNLGLWYKDPYPVAAGYSIVAESGASNTTLEPYGFRILRNI